MDEGLALKNPCLILLDVYVISVVVPLILTISFTSLVMEHIMESLMWHKQQMSQKNIISMHPGVLQHTKMVLL